MGSAASNTTYVARRQIRLLLRWAQGYHARLCAAGSRYSSRQVSVATLIAESCLGCLRRPPNPGGSFKKDFDMRRKRARDATNGRFITLAEAGSRPRETIIETIRKPCAAQARPSEAAECAEDATERAAGIAHEPGSCSV